MVVSGTFTGTETSHAITVEKGSFNLSLDGAGAFVVALERRFPEDTEFPNKWWKIEEFSADAERIFHNGEHRIEYRLNCTTHGGSNIDYRIGA